MKSRKISDCFKRQLEDYEEGRAHFAPILADARDRGVARDVFRRHRRHRARRLGRRADSG